MTGAYSGSRSPSLAWTRSSLGRGGVPAAKAVRDVIGQRLRASGPDHWVSGGHALLRT